MDSNTPEKPVKKGMHGALKFILAMFAGGFCASLGTPFFLGVVFAMFKAWTLKENYAFAINLFIISGLSLFVLTVLAGPFLKRWGLAGFFFGLCFVMVSGIAVAKFMMMFDVPR